MKRKLFTILLLWGTLLLAQKVDTLYVTDPSLLQSIRSIDGIITEQNRILDSLKIKSDSHLKEFQDYKVDVNSIWQEQRSVNSTNKINIQNIVVANKLQKATIDSLGSLIGVNSKNITVNSNQLGTEIQKLTADTGVQISALDDTIVENRLYWIIASLGTLLLGVLMYLFLGKRIKSSKIDVESQIRNTKQSLEEESVKLDNKLVEILETQLKVKQEEIKNRPSNSSVKADHSLALKVADEIIRMQKNIAKMDTSTKGIKPLLKGIERIQNNFSANGYEMINHINKEYDERMNIDVINFNTDDNLSDGKRIISAVIKPQVNYNGVLIQIAQVDVSQN